MFTFSGRFRRRVAVLSVLSLLASVLVVAAPAVAADPKADYKATFSACVGGAAEDQGFTDVPSGHANAGDIDCIAYYGVTKGTSASTYSPLMSVTREQMALFLTRLAGIVGIDVDDDPSDPGFTDTAGLSAESQMAIAQLAALGITKGNNASGTTYGPGNNVTRAHMALFVSRLMDQMVPQADGQIGLSSTTPYGYTPSDVVDNDNDADIGSPFTDLGRATKEQWDAITNLYELGVATGASGHPTNYGPDQDMTRASMAGFMAGVLDHSNARPAGLSIQATPTTGWGDVTATVLISVRDDEFGAVEDQSVDVFSSASANDGLRKDGTCNFGTNPDDVNFGDFITGDCVWSDNDDATDVDGNLILDEDVDQGESRLFYAWIGSKDGDKFDADTVDEQTASVTAKKEQTQLAITSTINKYADAGYGEDLDANTAGHQTHGQKVDLGEVDEVTFTAQLKDDGGGDVKRAGIEVRVEYRQGAETDGPRDSRGYVNSHEAVLETDENGQVSYTIQGPADNTRVHTQSRADDIVFVAKDLDEASEDVYWVEDDPVLTTSTIEVPTYVLAGSSSSVRATVYLWDQYGNPHQSHRSQKAVITIGADAVETVTDPATDDSKTSIRPVISRGYASWRHAMATVAGTRVNVVYDVRMLARNSNGQAVKEAANDDDLDDNDIAYNDGRVITTDDSRAAAVYDDDGNALSRPGSDQGYRNILAPDTTDMFNARATLYDGSTNDDAALNDDGDALVEVVDKAVSTNVDADVTVTHGKLEGEFLADTDADDDADRVYAYDDDDIFIDSTGDEGVEITMASFAAKINDGGNTVEVLAYDVDGSSIFRLKP